MEKEEIAIEKEEIISKLLKLKDDIEARLEIAHEQGWEMKSFESTLEQVKQEIDLFKKLENVNVEILDFDVDHTVFFRFFGIFEATQDLRNPINEVKRAIRLKKIVPEKYNIFYNIYRGNDRLLFLKIESRVGAFLIRILD